mgnify:CR=1 FL=1
MIKKRKNVLYAILVFFILIVFKLIKQNEVVQVPQFKKPNIIFIMADDLGYADLGCYGQKIIQTPNIDKLAKEGMRFTQTYSGSSVCAPARSVLMTGLHTGHTRVRGNFGLGGVKGLAGIEGRIPLMEEDITVAEVLKNAGYRTGMIGKWGLGEPNTEGEPNSQGFDEFYGFLNQRRAHSYYPDYVWKNRKKAMLIGNSDGNRKDYTHDIFANEAIEFIDRNQNNPFFLYLPLCIPHSNYELPDLGAYKHQKWDTDAKAYAAMISLMDVTVGRILQKLKESNIDENTIVFFTSDNGAAESTQIWKLFKSNSPLRGVKRDPYEGGIRVPMIVRYPNVIAQGEISDLPWYFADVLPTLAELSGASIPASIDGTSILYADKITDSIQKTNGETKVKKSAGTKYLNKHLDESGALEVQVSYKTDIVGKYTNRRGDELYLKDLYHRRMQNILNYEYSGEFLPMRENGNIVPWCFTTTLKKKVDSYFSNVEQNEFLIDKYKIKRNEKINGRRRSKKKSR